MIDKDTGPENDVTLDCTGAQSSTLISSIQNTNKQSVNRHITPQKSPSVSLLKPDLLSTHINTTTNKPTSPNSNQKQSVSPKKSKAPYVHKVKTPTKSHNQYTIQTLDQHPIQLPDLNITIPLSTSQTFGSPPIITLTGLIQSYENQVVINFTKLLSLFPDLTRNNFLDNHLDLCQTFITKFSIIPSDANGHTIMEYETPTPEILVKFTQLYFTSLITHIQNTYS